MEGALTAMLFTQALLIALIAWVSIGVYGSFYVIRSLASPRARRRTHEEIYKEAHPDAYGSPCDDPPNTRERRRIALDVAPGDDRVPPELFEDIEVPESLKDLRLSALFICGALGVFAVIGLAALGWAGSWRWYRLLRWHWLLRWRIRKCVVRWLLTGGADWAE